MSSSTPLAVVSLDQSESLTSQSIQDIVSISTTTPQFVVLTFSSSQQLLPVPQSIIVKSRMIASFISLQSFVSSISIHEIESHIHLPIDLISFRMCEFLFTWFEENVFNESNNHQPNKFTLLSDITISQFLFAAFYFDIPEALGQITRFFSQHVEELFQNKDYPAVLEMLEIVPQSVVIPHVSGDGSIVYDQINGKTQMFDAWTEQDEDLNQLVHDNVMYEISFSLYLCNMTSEEDRNFRYQMLDLQLTEMKNIFVKKGIEETMSYFNNHVNHWLDNHYIGNAENDFRQQLTEANLERINSIKQFLIVFLKHSMNLPQVLVQEFLEILPLKHHINLVNVITASFFKGYLITGKNENNAHLIIEEPYLSLLIQMMSLRCSFLEKKKNVIRERANLALDEFNKVHPLYQDLLFQNQRCKLMNALQISVRMQTRFMDSKFSTFGHLKEYCLNRKRDNHSTDEKMNESDKANHKPIIIQVAKHLSEEEIRARLKEAHMKEQKRIAEQKQLAKSKKIAKKD
jgi:hypothetical protein